MSFSPETEKLVNKLINAEYLNAIVNYGEKYHSLHEAYAVLKEEIEEVRDCYNSVLSIFHSFWEEIKCNETICIKTSLSRLEESVLNQIKELAQVGAVLQKIKNTIDEVEE